MSDSRPPRGFPIAPGAALSLAGLILAAFTAACSLPGQAAAPSPPPRPDTAALVRQLTACVRSHGDPSFPDPSIGQGGIPRWPSDTQPPPEEAQRACGSIYDPTACPSPRPPPLPAAQPISRKSGSSPPCMRRNGLVNWPDPNPDGSFSLPPEYQQKTRQLLTAWRDHCARYNSSGHIDVHQ